MAKMTRKTEPTTEPTTATNQPAARRVKESAPAEGAGKVTTRRKTKTVPEAETAGHQVRQGSAGEPTHDEIALRAWSIYLDRGASHGQAMTDWLEAKRQLFAERKLAE